MLDNQHAITELTDILDRDIETIVAMRMRAKHKVSRHQRLIEKVSSTLGQPGAVYSIILLVVLWITVNVLHSQLCYLSIINSRLTNNMAHGHFWWRMSLEV